MLGVIDPLALKWLVDSALPARRIDLAVIAAVLFVSAQGARVAISTLSGIVIYRAAQRAILKLRTALLKHISTLSMEFHSVTPSGEKVFLIDRDVEQIIESGSSVLMQLLSLTSSMAITIATMLYLSPALLGILVPVNAVCYLLRRVFRSRIETASMQAQVAGGQANAFVQEHLANVLQLQLLCCEREMLRRTTSALVTKTRLEWHRRITETIFSNISFGIVIIGTASVLAVGSLQVLRGTMTVGALLASYALLARLFDPFGVAATIYAQAGRVRASLYRIRNIFDMAPTVPDLGKAILNPAAAGVKVEFQNVSFRYSQSHALLNCLSFHIDAGEKIGLTGPSGSGKTTIARLIARLQDTTSGRVTMDDADLRDYSLHSLRAAVCYIHQEATLFNRTIAENLRLGSPLATESELWHALKIVRMESAVGALQDGLHAVTGQQGVRFSGGERQRLILARALLCRPAMLILDEATAAIDQVTENRILRSLRDEFPAQTVVLISHRASSLSWADRIIFLDEGMVRHPSSSATGREPEVGQPVCL